MMSMRKTNNLSSSEYDLNRYTTITDEKKRKRMISNRESARRSRMKREQHIKDLNDQVTYYRTRSSNITQKIDKIQERYAATESDNRILRMQVEELNKRLELLEQVLASYNSSNYVSDAARKGGEFLQEPLPQPWLQPPPFRSRAVDGIHQF